MTLNLTNFNPMIKEHYAPGPVVNMAYSKNKAMGLMAKRNRKPSGTGGIEIEPKVLGIGYAEERAECDTYDAARLR